MQNFTYCNPTRIEFGKNKEKNIGKYISEYGVKKVLLTYGSNRIKKDGLYDSVVNSLKEFDIEFVELGGIISNPVLSKVREGITLAKEEKVEAILSVGGGSVIDSSKTIAVGAVNDGDVWDFFVGTRTIEKALSVFDIITLAATGSEMNSFAVVTNEETKEKYSIMSNHIYPKVSVINPELQKSVSKNYLVYSAADIIAHSIEGYFTAKVHPTIISKYVESNISTVIETTEILLENGEDYNARAQFAWAATNALNGTTYLGVSEYSFPNHMIEHSLSALFNVAHGAGLSVVMPAWMKWYYKNNPVQFERFANEIFGVYSSQEGIESLENWFNKIGTPTKLSQLNIKESDISAIVENILNNAKHSGLDNIYTKEVLTQILRNAL